MKELKVWYCDVKVESTVTLQALAASEEEAREKFQSGQFFVFDTVTPIKDVKDFGPLRNDCGWEDLEGEDD